DTTTAPAQEVMLDVHSIEQIPEEDRDSTPWDQCWVWAGANMAPSNWIRGARGVVPGLGLVGAILAVVLGGLIGCACDAALSWMASPSDYSRFVPRRFSSKQVFWYSYWGMFIPTVWLAVLGATIASADASVDPARLVTDVFGGIVAVLVMLMVLHGPIATNI